MTEEELNYRIDNLKKFLETLLGNIDLSYNQRHKLENELRKI